MNIEEYLQREIKKVQKKRSIQGQIYKLSKEAEVLKDSNPKEYQSRIKRIEELKERMKNND